MLKSIAQSTMDSQGAGRPSNLKHSQPLQLSLIAMREEQPSDHQDFNKDFDRDTDQVQGDLLLALIKRQLNMIERSKFMEKMRAL